MPHSEALVEKVAGYFFRSRMKLPPEETQQAWERSLAHHREMLAKYPEYGHARSLVHDCFRDAEVAIAALTTTAEEDTVTEEQIDAALAWAKADGLTGPADDTRRFVRGVLVAGQSIPVRSIEGGERPNYLRSAAELARRRLNRGEGAVQEALSPSTPAGVADEVERAVERMREVPRVARAIRMGWLDDDDLEELADAALQRTTPESGNEDPPECSVCSRAYGLHVEGCPNG